MADEPTLAAWLYGTRVANLSSSAEGRIELVWTEDALDRWGLNARVMSNLLPITRPDVRPAPPRVKAFIDGLLPEGHSRTNYAVEAGIAPDDSFGLLARYGRDTAGALVFQSPDAPEPSRLGQYRNIDDAGIACRLRDAERHAPDRGPDRSRDSSTLAGMQPKITVHRDAQGWQACLDGAPSTWIVKLAHPADSDAADVIDTEVLSLDLARLAGLAAAHAEIHTFDGVRTIAVLRYDRVSSEHGITRVHQEDLAQAIGLDTADPLRKFQRGNRMPSLTDAAAVLRTGGAQTDDLLRLTTLNYLLGNIDAHAKNISFLRLEDGSVLLAPAYDIAMHLHHGGEQHRSALDLNGKILYRDLDADDLVAEAERWGLSGRRARALVRNTVEAVGAALDGLDPAGYPGVTDAAWQLVRDRIELTHRQLAAPGLAERAAAPARQPPVRRGPIRRRPVG